MKPGDRFTVSAVLALEHDLHGEDCFVEFVDYDPATRVPIFKSVVTEKVFPVENTAMLTPARRRKPNQEWIREMPAERSQLLRKVRATERLLEVLAELEYSQSFYWRGEEQERGFYKDLTSEEKELYRAGACKIFQNLINMGFALIRFEDIMGVYDLGKIERRSVQ